jgi:phytoene desaturase
VKKRIVVIGAGFGGLGAAARLAASGHQVTLVEALDKLGGRGYVFEQDGFKFDAGPTIITAPWMFDDIWQKAGKRREDYVTFSKCDPFYRIFDHHHVPFDYNDDEMFILSEIDKRNPADKRGYLNFVAMAKKIFDKGFVELADKPFLSVADMLKVAPELIRLQSYKSVYQFVSGYIQDPFLRQVFSFHPLLVGGNPFDTTSIYAMIHYLEREWGVWYAMGGTGRLVEAFGELIRDIGGEIILNAPVEQILVENGPDGKPRTTGVALADGRVLPADVVVSNADVAHTYGALIDAKYRKKMTDAKLERIRYAMSLVVIYFGTKRRYASEGKLAHHNILQRHAHQPGHVTQNSGGDGIGAVALVGVEFDQFVSVVGERLGKDQDYLLNSSKIRSEFGWSDAIDLGTGLRETLAWVDANIEILSTLPMDYIHKS